MLNTQIKINNPILSVLLGLSLSRNEHFKTGQADTFDLSVDRIKSLNTAEFLCKFNLVYFYSINLHYKRYNIEICYNKLA